MVKSFVKKLALDYIITENNDIYLIELQNGFGKFGLLELFPDEWRKYRKLLRYSVRKNPPEPEFLRKFKKICRSKIETYRLFKDFQPRSYILRSWNRDKIQLWLNSLKSKFVLAKPPTGSCGMGIHLFDKDEVLDNEKILNSGESHILQEYIFSKNLNLDQGCESRAGCIRHVILLKYDGLRMKVLHLPSYWRVAPMAYSFRISRESLTANISRGAIPVPVNENDYQLVMESANKVACALSSFALGNLEILMGASNVLGLDISSL